MKIFVLLALLCYGCATFQTPDGPDTLPQLIYQAPLPPWPTPSYVPGLTLELLIRVTSDGSVHKAVLLTQSGNLTWDSLALETIQRWRFSPARMGNTPVPCWIQQKARVQFEAAVPMVLSELVCTDYTLADSLCALLMDGASFDSLARQFSVAASRDRGGFLGEIDIRAYPLHVRSQLADLHVGDITKPLVLGQNVIIFKRLARVW